MKWLFTTVYSTVLTFNFAFAQSTDAPLARIEQKETAVTKTAAADIKLTDAKETGRDEVTTATRPAFVMPAPTSQTSKKVGPKGEELFMKRNRYYYLNDAGKKIKVKSSELRDIPKSS
jgi:hypothetical protein